MGWENVHPAQGRLDDRYNCPAFLRNCNAYREYLIKTKTRDLKLPTYTTVSLYEGESTSEIFTNCVNRTLLVKSLCTMARYFVVYRAVHTNMSVHLL